MLGSGTARVAIVAGAAFGMFFPSSISEVILPMLDRLAIGLNAMYFAVLLLRRRGVADSIQSVGALAILAWLALITSFYPAASWSIGSGVMFLGLALMLSMQLRDLTAGRFETWFLAGINLFAIGVGTGLVWNIQAVNQFVKASYSAFYQELVIAMVDWFHKPVLTFGTHSTAGLFFYLFFYLNLRTFEATGRRRWLVIAAAHVVVGTQLWSTTSTVLMTLAAAQLVFSIWRRYGRQLVWMVALAPLVLTGLILWNWEAVVEWPTQVVGVIVGNRGAGLLGRYSDTGMLAGNLRYLSENPFAPIGVTYGDEELFYGDSGLVILILRGSVPLVLLVYLGFCRWMMLNVRSHRDLLVIGLVTLAFEIGYTPLLLFRFTAFLPFVLVYLNTLSSIEERTQSDAHAAALVDHEDERSLP